MALLPRHICSLIRGDIWACSAPHRSYAGVALTGRYQTAAGYRRGFEGPGTSPILSLAPAFIGVAPHHCARALGETQEKSAAPQPQRAVAEEPLSIS